MNTEELKIEQNKYVDFIGNEFIETSTSKTVRIYAINIATWVYINNEKEDLLCFFLEFPYEINYKTKFVPVESFHNYYTKIV